MKSSKEYELIERLNKNCSMIDWKNEQHINDLYMSPLIKKDDFYINPEDTIDILRTVKENMKEQECNKSFIEKDTGTRINVHVLDKEIDGRSINSTTTTNCDDKQWITTTSMDKIHKLYDAIEKSKKIESKLNVKTSESEYKNKPSNYADKCKEDIVKNVWDSIYWTLPLMMNSMNYYKRNGLISLSSLDNIFNVFIKYCEKIYNDIKNK